MQQQQQQLQQVEDKWKRRWKTTTRKKVTHAMFGTRFALATTATAKCVGHAVGIWPLHEPVVAGVAND